MEANSTLKDSIRFTRTDFIREVRRQRQRKLEKQARIDKEFVALEEERARMMANLREEI